MISRATGHCYEPTKLLYPIEEKNYADTPFLRNEWNRLRSWLSSDTTKLVTIFGYGAPKSDFTAIQTMNDAWKSPNIRNHEQFEIIDIMPREAAVENWKKFIFSHHVDCVANFFDSTLAKNPRRSSEYLMHRFFPSTEEESFMPDNPIPNDFETLGELWAWHRTLIEEEEELDLS